MTSNVVTNYRKIKRQINFYRLLLFTDDMLYVCTFTNLIDTCNRKEIGIEKNKLFYWIVINWMYLPYLGNIEKKTLNRIT